MCIRDRLQGIPTPNVTPGAPLWAPVTVGLVGPQGYVFNGTNSAVLDVTSSGSATLYEGNNSELAWVGNAGEAIPTLGQAYEPVEAVSYTHLSLAGGIMPLSSQTNFSGISILGAFPKVEGSVIFPVKAQATQVSGLAR